MAKGVGDKFGSHKGLLVVGIDGVERSVWWSIVGELVEENVALSFAGAEVRVSSGTVANLIAADSIFWSLKVSMMDLIHATSFKSCKGAEGAWWMWPLMVRQMSHRRKACKWEVVLLEMKRHSVGQRSQKKAAMMRPMVDWWT